jgi:hypothetical protein
MTNTEIISEVNGLLQRALGLLATIEKEPPDEEAHAEEADETQDVPALTAQGNVAEATVHAAEAEATMVSDQI